MKNQFMLLQSTGTRYALIRKTNLLSALLIFGFILSSFLAQSQTLSDFRSAASKSKMAVIPYKPLVKKIAEAQKKKGVAFRAIAGYRIGELTSTKKNKLQAIKDKKEAIKEAEDELKDYDGDSSSEKSKLSSEVKKLEDELEDLDDELSTLNTKIKTGGEKWEALYNARMEVKSKYIDVKNALQKSLSSPSNHLGSKPSSSDREAYDQYEDDVRELKSLIAKIKSKMNSEFSAHQGYIDDAKENQEKYEDLFELD